MWVLGIVVDDMAGAEPLYSVEVPRDEATMLGRPPQLECLVVPPRPGSNESCSRIRIGWVRGEGSGKCKEA